MTPTSPTDVPDRRAVDMTSEPIRLPAVVVAVLLLVGPPLAAVLLGADIRETVATTLLGLVASGGVLGYTESVRARTDSPATIARRLAGLAASPLPEDERTGCD